MTVALVVCIKRRSGLSGQEFARYWREVHAPLIRDCGGFNRHLVSYTQYHLVEQDSPVARMFGVSGDYDGIAVLEFRSVTEMQQAFAEPAYLEHVRPDEPNFVDLEHGLCFITEPNKVI
ncbi:MAG: EthD domain-containing protein [Novosphingobium sp.]|nr:EthD domain-containing protein [Novosphingobium sp.]